MKTALVVAAVLAPLPVHAQKAGFISIVGVDTIASEVFTVTPTALEGELSMRTAKKPMRYVAAIQDGRVRTLRVDDVETTFAGDTIPFINLAFSLVEVATRRMASARQDSAHMQLAAVGTTLKLAGRIQRFSADSAVFTVSGMPLVLRLGEDGRILRAELAAQRLVVIRTDGSPLGLRKADYSAPADGSFTAEDVAIPAREGFILAGTLTLPRNRTGRVPVVVTISGSGQQDRDETITGVSGYAPFRQFAVSLAQRGIGVLRYDDRGVGDSKGDPSKATTADFADDTRAIIAWLRTRPDVDAKNLFVIGHSEGAMIAPMLAATDTSLRGIVLMAGPAYPGKRIIEYQGLDRDTTLMAIPWMRFFKDYDPLPTARSVRVPVLILHGETDRQVTVEQAPLLAAAFREGGNADVAMHVLSGINHLFLKDPRGTPSEYGGLKETQVPDDVVALIGDWIIQHVR